MIDTIPRPAILIAMAKMKVTPPAIAVCLVLALMAAMTTAQPLRSGEGTPNQMSGSQYYVWGQVRAPGAYSFVAAPDIIELLSTAGGPSGDANLSRVVLIRAVTNKRMRVNLRAMLASGQVLRLSPGDVLIVPSTSWPSFRDGLTVLTSLASLTTAVISIILLARGR